MTRHSALHLTQDGVLTTATYDAANQLTALGTTSYGYDRNGNTTRSGCMELGYDASDKTTRIDTVGHCPTQQGGTVLTLGYDGWGRRVSRTVGSLQTEYWYDVTGLSREYEAATGTGQTGGRGETLYTRSPGGGLLSIKTGGATRNYGMDRLDSVTALTGTDGSLDATYRYDPWGASNGNTGTAYNPYRYTGTYYDSASDLYQMGARYYQAKSKQLVASWSRPGKLPAQFVRLAAFLLHFQRIQPRK